MTLFWVIYRGGFAEVCTEDEALWFSRQPDVVNIVPVNPYVDLGDEDEERVLN